MYFPNVDMGWGSTRFFERLFTIVQFLMFKQMWAGVGDMAKISYHELHDDDSVSC